MEHIYWVIEYKLAGRAGPTRTPWNPAELYAAGIRSIISLASDVEVEDLTPYGINHYRQKFPPVLLTSRGMQKAFIHEALPVWTLIHAQLEAAQPTLVHCYAGNDRTGAILAGYLVLYEKLTPEAAIERVRVANPEAMTAEGYLQAVQRLEPGCFPDPRTLL